MVGEERDEPLVSLGQVIYFRVQQWTVARCEYSMDTQGFEEHRAKGQGEAASKERDA